MLSEVSKPYQLMPEMRNSAPLGAMILFPLVVQPADAGTHAQRTSRQAAASLRVSFGARRYVACVYTHCQVGVEL